MFGFTNSGSPNLCFPLKGKDVKVNSRINETLPMMNIDGLSIMSNEENTDPYLYDDFHEGDFPLVDDAVFDYEEEWFDDGPLPPHSGIIIHDGSKNKNNNYNHNLYEHNNNHRDNKNTITASKLCYLPPCDPYSPDAINHGHDNDLPHHHLEKQHAFHEHIHHDHRLHPQPVHHVTALHHPEPLHYDHHPQPFHHQNFISTSPPPDFNHGHYQHVVHHQHHPTPRIKTVYPNLIPRPRPSFLPPVHNPNWSTKLSTTPTPTTTQIPHLLSTIGYELPSLSLNALFSSLTPPSTTFSPPILASVTPRPSSLPPISSHHHHDWSDLPPVHEHHVSKISPTDVPHHLVPSPATILTSTSTPEQQQQSLHLNTLVPPSSNSLDLGALPALPSTTTPSSTLFSSPIPLGIPSPSTTFAPPPIFPHHHQHDLGRHYHDLDVAHHGSIGLQTSLIPPSLVPSMKPSVRFIQASNFIQQPPATTPVTYGTTTTLAPLVNGLHYSTTKQAYSPSSITPPPSNLASQIVVHSTTTSQPLLLLFKQKKTTSSPTSSSSSTSTLSPKNTLFEALVASKEDTKESDLKRLKEKKNEEERLVLHQHIGQYLPSSSLPSFSSIFSPSALSEELSSSVSHPEKGEEEMGYLYNVHPSQSSTSIQKESEKSTSEQRPPQKTYSDNNNQKISSSHDTVGYNVG